MKFACPLCGKKIECEDSWAGAKTACPACGGEITIPKVESLYEQQSSIRVAKEAFIEADQFLRKSTNWKERLFSFKNADGSFKTPLLSNILYYASMIMATLLCIAIVIIIFLALYLDDTARGVRTMVFWTIVDVIKYIIFMLGVAQVIYAVCKTCYHTERIDKQMSKDKK